MSAETHEPKRRVMRLQVTPEFLVRMCKPSDAFAVRVTGGKLPIDARSVGVTHDYLTNSFFIFVESQEFDSVPEGNIPPLLPPVVLKSLVVPMDVGESVPLSPVGGVSFAGKDDPFVSRDA